MDLIDAGDMRGRILPLMLVAELLIEAYVLLLSNRMAASSKAFGASVSSQF